jgi:hypothetical protein
MWDATRFHFQHIWHIATVFTFAATPSLPFVIRNACLEIPWQACLDLTIGMQALIHPDSFCEDVADASSDDRSGSEDESAVPSHWGQVQYVSIRIENAINFKSVRDLSIYLSYISPHQHEYLSRTWILLKRKRRREHVV